MKTAIFVIGLSAILMEPAGAQTNQPAPPTAATNDLSPDVLVTKLGTVYNQYRVVRKDPAGLIIHYVPDGGGIGMEKVPFDLLPEDWQQRFKYDPQKAAQFDLEQQKAMAFWREKMIADEQANREKWARLAAEEEAAEQAKRDAEAAQKAAEAAAAQDTNAPAIQTNDVPTIQINDVPTIQTNNAPTIQATNAPPMTYPSPPPPPPWARPSRNL